MRRNADLVDDLGDERFERSIAALRLCGRQLRRVDLTDAVEQRHDVAGLGDKIRRTQRCALGDDLIVVEARHHEPLGIGAGLGQAAQHLDAVELGQHKVEHQHIGLALGHHGKRIHAVADAADKLQILLVAQHLGHEALEVIVCVCDKYTGFGFHN